MEKKEREERKRGVYWPSTEAASFTPSLEL
jgi:hypothetical protein